MKVLKLASRPNILGLVLYAITSALGFAIALFFASGVAEAALISLSLALFLCAAVGAKQSGESGFLQKLALATDEFAAFSPLNFAMFYLPCAIHRWFKDADMSTMLDDSMFFFAMFRVVDIFSLTKRGIAHLLIKLIRKSSVPVDAGAA
jgi:hypothetical protein